MTTASFDVCMQHICAVATENGLFAKDARRQPQASVLSILRHAYSQSSFERHEMKFKQGMSNYPLKSSWPVPRWIHWNRQPMNAHGSPLRRRHGHTVADDDNQHRVSQPRPELCPARTLGEVYSYSTVHFSDLLDEWISTASS
jgi:hypothetical protein